MPNRDALLEAGIACLQANGYADTTARDIAGRAGVSLGAIGYHFGTKDDLLNEALTEAVRRWLTPLIELVVGLPDHIGQEDLGAAVNSLLATLEKNRPLVISYFQALLRAEHAPSLREAMAADFDALRRALTGGVQELQREVPSAHRVDADVAATLLMSIFDGLIIQWLLDPGRLPSGDVIAATLKRAAALHEKASGDAPRAETNSTSS